MAARLALILLPLALLLTTPASPALAAGQVNTWACSTGDSASGCSSTTLAPMPTARSGLAMTSLSSDGKLYAVGGQTGTSTYTGVTQAYSPTGNNWATLAADTARTGSVAGGYTLAGTTYLYVAGGYTGTWSGLVSYLDPPTNSWGSVASLPTARAYLGTAVGSDGWVYTIGGQDSSGDLNVVQAFSPTALDWYCSSSVTGCTKTSTPPVAMPTARSKMAVVADSNGLIYVIGGETASGVYTNVVEAYNPSTRTWTCSVGDTSPGCSSTTIAPMPTSRDADADTTADGLIYVIGGNNSTGNLTSLEVFDPSTNSWACSTADTAGSGCSSKVLTDLPTARAGAAVATGSDGRLYVVGGNNGSYLSTVEAYQPPTVPGAPGSVTATGGERICLGQLDGPHEHRRDANFGIHRHLHAGLHARNGPQRHLIDDGVGPDQRHCLHLYRLSHELRRLGRRDHLKQRDSLRVRLRGVIAFRRRSRQLRRDPHRIRPIGLHITGHLPSGGHGLRRMEHHLPVIRLHLCRGHRKVPHWRRLTALRLSAARPADRSLSHRNHVYGKVRSPSISISGNTPIDTGSAVKVASAQSGTGLGTYDFTPGNIGVAGNNLQLTLPSYAYSTTYGSTITESIVSGP